MANIREADIGQFGIESEATFLGVASGFLYDTKIVGFEWKSEFAQRSTKVNVWRQETSQAFHGISHSGSIELEMQSSQGLLQILSAFMTRKSWTVGASLDTYVFRPWKNEDPPLPSLIFRIAIGNPAEYWMTFSGVVIEKVRFQARQKSIGRISIDWMAAAMTETTVDPSWTFLDGSQGYLMTSDSTTITVGGADATQLLEAGVEFRDPKGFQKMDRTGVFSQVSRKGSMSITGTLVDQYQYSLGMPSKARAGTETAVVMNHAAQGEASLYLKVNLPRVMFQDADPVAMQAGPQVVNAPFKALIDDVLDTDAEPEITLITGTPSAGGSSGS